MPGAGPLPRRFPGQDRGKSPRAGWSGRPDGQGRRAGRGSQEKRRLKQSGLAMKPLKPRSANLWFASSKAELCSTVRMITARFLVGATLSTLAHLVGCAATAPQLTPRQREIEDAVRPLLSLDPDVE